MLSDVAMDALREYQENTNQRMAVHGNETWKAHIYENSPGYF